MVLMNTHTHTHTIHHHHHHHRKPELTLGCLLILRFCWHYIDRTSLVANYGRETQDGDAVICYVLDLLFARFVICMFMTAKSWRYSNGHKQFMSISGCIILWHPRRLAQCLIGWVGSGAALTLWTSSATSVLLSDSSIVPAACGGMLS